MAHINHEQRHLITIMLKQDTQQKEMAQIINQRHFVVSREIQRNWELLTDTYESITVQRAYDRRLKTKPKIGSLRARSKPT